MADGTEGSALDRPAARFAAVVICAAALGALGYLHRDDLFPPDPAAVADAPFRKCIAERGGHIDKMQSEGTIRPDQAKLFRARAEAMCRARTTEGGSGAPPPPRR